MADIARAEIGAPTRVKRKPRIFYGWYIVAAGAAMNVYGSGVWVYGFPIFYKALLEEFGWARATGAAVISLARLEGGLEGPIIGWLIDKFGPRKLAIFGAVLFAVGLLLMSMVTSISIGPIHVSALVANIWWTQKRLFFFEEDVWATRSSLVTPADVANSGYRVTAQPWPEEDAQKYKDEPWTIIESFR